MDIALIAPPWPLFNRPSIQLAVLKAFLRKNLPSQIRVTSLHPYLKIAEALGYNNYHQISQSSWASEAVFAHVLFPGREGPGRLYQKSIETRSKGRVSVDFENVASTCQTAINSYLKTIDFSGTRLAGISVCLNQLTAGLYLAKLLKDKYPDMRIVMGGASVSGPVGKGILEAFPWVDFVIGGEGELPMLELCQYALGISDTIKSKAILSRADSSSPNGKEQVKDLNSLPPPDYDDYFRELATLKGAGGIQVVLPVEASRGCWWGRCSFCNLNLQWKGYRWKKPQRVASEIDFLSKRYSAIDFAFMDNCLPRRSAHEIFEQLCLHKRDYSIFAELRAVHSKKEMATMRRGGLRTVQIGIEALSSRVLKRLRKGSTAIQNLAAMKNCAETGIDLQSNLITCFPGTTREEVEETLENLDFAWPFAPLKPVKFWLGMESPAFLEQKEFGIRFVRPDRKYKMLFPDDVACRLVPLILEYSGDRGKQEHLWKPVEKKLSYFLDRRKGLGIRASALTYRDGGHFLLIKQVLPEGQVLNHRLSGPSRKLYLAADEPVSFEQLFDVVPEIPYEKKEAFLRQMAAKRLMFLEEGMALALACKDSCNLW